MTRAYKCQCGFSLNDQKWIQLNKHIYQTTLTCCPINTNYYKCNPETCSNPNNFKYNYYKKPNSAYLKKHIEKYHMAETDDNP